MAAWVCRPTQFWDEWGLRIAVLASLGAHVVLVLTARTRRQNMSPCMSVVLWFAYQIADIAATYAVGKLSLGGTGACTSGTSSSCEQVQRQQLVAFWAPFLLLHLGRPDNISAYALEDNTFSLRQVLEVILQLAGALYILYNYIYLGHSGVLLPASVIMFAAGVAKYAERVFALRRGNLENMRDSSKEKQRQQRSTGDHVVPRTTTGTTPWRVLDNEQALRFAHDLFHLCKRAMVDSSSMASPDSGMQIFLLKWRSMCMVVEMELSLMYDMLYTKASVIHTWGGYVIRIISPFATATAASLFWLLEDDCLATADVVITNMLLVATFLLDVVWLVRALGSTWTYGFLNDRPQVVWLYHSLLCSGRWRGFRRIFVSLDPSSWLLGQDPTIYRMWSGNIGQYNLLHECTRPRSAMDCLWSWLANKAGFEDFYYSRRLSEQLQPVVKELLFRRIRNILVLASEHSAPPDGPEDDDTYAIKDITTTWGQKAVKTGTGKEIFKKRDEAEPYDVPLPSFGREFQEDILVWHIGTSILLACANQKHVEGPHGKAIKVLSEYLMFLVAVRRHMLPGLVLRSLFEVTHKAMIGVWAEVGSKKNNNCSSFRSRKDIMLAMRMHELKSVNKDWGQEANRKLISDAITLAIVLLEVQETDKLMEVVFDVWIHKLLYAGAQCSRESHAKQLSRGGELTSIAWIITEHAGTFRIGEEAPLPPPIRKPKSPILWAAPIPMDYPPSSAPPTMEMLTPIDEVESIESRKRRRLYATLYPP